jgi:hypothetical protein
MELKLGEEDLAHPIAAFKITQESVGYHPCFILINPTHDGI